MKKKIFIAIGIIIVIIAGIVAAMVMTSNNALPTTYLQAKASTNSPAACVAENKDLIIDTETQKAVEMTAISQLIDVPAGTETTLRLATYDGTTVTGSQLYSGDYGTYNFIMKKDSSASWKMTSFVLCEN